MLENTDPRIKIIIVMVLSSLAVFVKRPSVLLVIFLAGLIIAKLFGGQFFSVIKKVRKMLYLFIGIIIIQSIFTNEGYVILGVKQIALLTDVGLLKGINYFFRVLIILVSGTILATSSEIEMVAALIKWHIPYDLAFMVALGIRFMPVFMSEFQDTIVAIELRGIDIKKLKLTEKFELYTYIFTPVVLSSLEKAKRLSLSIEMRGFRLHDKRTSHMTLKFSIKDYILLAITTLTLFVILKI